MHLRPLLLVAALLCLVAAASAAPAPGPEVVYKSPNDALAGLTGVHVSVVANFVDVGAVGEDMGKTGLSRIGIKTMIEKSLRDAKIMVYDNTAVLTVIGEPEMEASILLAQVGLAGYVYHVELNVDETVTPARSPNVRVRTDTWGLDHIGYVSRSDLAKPDALRIGQLVDPFISAYRKANPAP